MLSRRDTERLTGALLIMSFILFLGHVITLLTEGAGRTTMVWVLVYGFPVGLAGVALYTTFRTHEPTLAGFSAFGFAAHSILVVVTAALLLAGIHFPQEFATFGGDSAPGLWVGGSLELGMDKIRSSAFVFLSLGFLPLGRLLLQSGAVPRWIAWLGISGGLFGVAAMFPLLAGLPPLPLPALPQITAVLLFGFMLALGVRLTAWGVGTDSAPVGSKARV